MHIFTVRGRGMPHLRGARAGDLLVQVRLETPKKLTARQKELYTELKEIEDKCPQTKGFFDRIREFFSGSNEESKAEKS